MRVALLVLLVIAPAACSTEPPPSESDSATSGAGVGTITFGSIANPETSFALNEEVAWAASLATPIEGTKVNIVIARPGEEAELFGYEQFITNPGATTLVNRMPLGRFLPEAGDYVMRYVTTDGRVVAEGEFELVRSN
jgi:hypothetical protein